MVRGKVTTPTIDAYWSRVGGNWLHQAVKLLA